MLSHNELGSWQADKKQITEIGLHTCDTRTALAAGGAHYSCTDEHSCMECLHGPNDSVALCYCEKTSILLQSIGRTGPLASTAHKKAAETMEPTLRPTCSCG